MRRLRLALAPLALVLAAGLAGPAYAQHKAVHDPAKDAVNERGDVVPTDRDADITRFDTTLTHRRLTLGLRLRAVADRDDAQVIGVLTPGSVYAVTSFWTGHGTTHSVMVRRYRSIKGKGNGTKVTCAGLREHRSATTITVSLPASCVGTPHWVRTFAFASYDDDTDQTGTRGKVDYQHPHLGPKVHA